VSKSMKILVAYDGSPFAEQAIDDLQRAGLPDNVEAIVLSAADVWVPPQGDAVTSPPTKPSANLQEVRQSTAVMLERARAQAETGASRLRQLFPTWHITAESTADAPAWAIVLRAEAWGADLIVVGSHGYSALQRLVLGSVSQAVLTHTRTSVRIARGRSTPAAQSPRILVAIDGSNESDLAVRTAARRNWPSGTEIRLILVLNSSLLEAIPTSEVVRQESNMHPVPNQSEGDEVEDIEALIGRMLDSYCMLFDQAANITVTSEIHSGDPKRVLVEEADKWSADCIFLGSRGLGGWERVLLGSVSSAVATRADCSVEVIRQHINA
jgi:nucleotide-binding universal stress UspA family protein